MICASNRLFFKSMKLLFVLKTVKYRLVLCLSTQWTTPSLSTGFTDLAAASAQKWSSCTMFKLQVLVTVYRDDVNNMTAGCVILWLCTFTVLWTECVHLCVCIVSTSITTLMHWKYLWQTTVTILRRGLDNYFYISFSTLSRSTGSAATSAMYGFLHCYSFHTVTITYTKSWSNCAAGLF